MMIVVAVQGDQLSYMLEGGDPAMAVQVLTAAAQAITQKLAAEGQAAPSAPPVPPRPSLYLPNGHGRVPPMSPGGQQ